MTDDIVTRLRAAIHAWAESEWVDVDDWKDAADEIEDYRAEVKRMFDMITKQRKEIERLRAELEGAHKAIWDDTLIPIADSLGIKLYDDLGNPLRQFQVVEAILKAVRGD